ncbi:MAG: hypothetical protein ACFFCS_27025 [Candidatus Hodarchaeota archaeon]
MYEKKKKKKNREIKSLITKWVSISILQGIIYAIFILIDPGFQHSLMYYFLISLSVSIIAITYVHFRSLQIDEQTLAFSVLDETDYAGDD